MTPTTEKAPTPPRVAIVIVSRNQRGALERCLRTLGKGYVLIVVDSGAGDTAGLDEKFPDVRYIRLPRHFGLTKALNLGIRAAETELVLLLSPDVEMNGAAVDALADTLESQATVGAVCPRLLRPDGSPADQARHLPSVAEPDPPLRPAQPGETVTCVSVDAVMFRMFFLRALRDIDERFGEYGSAIELSQQVKRANKTILVHPEATAVLNGPAPKPTTEEQADREVGTAKFLSKHCGFLSGVRYWLGCTLGSLVSFQLGKFVQVASWKKIDGN